MAASLYHLLDTSGGYLLTTGGVSHLLLVEAPNSLDEHDAPPPVEVPDWTGASIFGVRKVKRLKKQREQERAMLLQDDEDAILAVIQQFMQVAP